MDLLLLHLCWLLSKPLNSCRGQLPVSWDASAKSQLILSGCSGSSTTVQLSDGCLNANDPSVNDPPFFLFAGFPEGCHQLFLEGERSSGVFHIQPTGSQVFEAFCDMSLGKKWGEGGLRYWVQILKTNII